MVLIGASNLAQGLGCALDETLARIGPATRVLAAGGRGRSYGLWSSFLARGLPAALECGLWRALEEPPRAALLSDVGNDLAYGVEPGQVLEWVRTAAARLGAERLVLAGLPCARLASLSPAAIALWGRVIFPTRRIDARRILEQALELDRGLACLARELGATRVELPARWYGLDPIHVARRARREAWSALCAGFGERGHAPVRPFSSGLGLAAEERTLFGVRLRRAQPCWRSPEGAELWLF